MTACKGRRTTRYRKIDMPSSSEEATTDETQGHSFCGASCAEEVQWQRRFERHSRTMNPPFTDEVRESVPQILLRLHKLPVPHQQHARRCRVPH